MLNLKEPNAVLPLLPIPIVPEHVWSDVSEDEVRSYRQRAHRRASRSSGPARSGCVEGTAGGSTYRFEANPDYWKGAPHIDEVVFRVYKTEDPAIQALIKGEVDFVEEINALQVESLQGREGITAHNGDSPGFDEIAFNTGSIDLETGEPIGDPNPAVLDPAFRWALNFAIDREQIIQTAYQGARQPGATIIPPAYTDYQLGAAGRRTRRLRPRKAGQLLDEAGYTMGADGKRTLPNGDPIGTLRLLPAPTPARRSTSWSFFSEWLADARHRLRGRGVREQQADQRHPRRASSTPSSGAGTSSPTRTRCCAT